MIGRLISHSSHVAKKFDQRIFNMNKNVLYLYQCGFRDVDDLLPGAIWKECEAVQGPAGSSVRSNAYPVRFYIEGKTLYLKPALGSGSCDMCDNPKGYHMHDYEDLFGFGIHCEGFDYDKVVAVRYLYNHDEKIKLLSSPTP